MLGIISSNDRERCSGMLARAWNPPGEVTAGVTAILRDVRSRGDAAVLEYTRRFDAPAFDENAIQVDIPPVTEAERALPAGVAAALRLARERVTTFHERQKTRDVAYTEEDGTRYEFRSAALGSVGVYVPGGNAILPDSVIMGAVPARVAGVKRVAVFSPPRRDGSTSPAILFACALCEVNELYAAGGAQAIGAAAFGTRRIGRVDKIVGPGNVWVTEAKRQVYGICGIDGLAGPSEVLVVADERADPEYVVAELLAQAEHDADARVGVVSESRELLEACLQRVRGRVGVGQAFFIHATSRAAAVQVANDFAPEHLSLQVENPAAYLSQFESAGAIFVGSQTSVASGDYLAGTNHVLPTAGAARFASGLRLADFQRTFSVLEYSRERSEQDAAPIAALAEFEGLPNHAAAARLRAKHL